MPFTSFPAAFFSFLFSSSSSRLMNRCSSSSSITTTLSSSSSSSSYCLFTLLFLSTFQPSFSSFSSYLILSLSICFQSVSSRQCQCLSVWNMHSMSGIISQAYILSFALLLLLNRARPPCHLFSNFIFLSFSLVCLCSIPKRV